MQVLSASRRTGRIVSEIAPDPGMNRVTVRLPVDASSLPGRVTAVSVRLEQTADGVQWWPLGSFAVPDVRAMLAGTDKRGNPATIWGRFTEQLYRGDAYKSLRFDQFGGSAYDLRNPDDGAEYYQLQLCNRLRIIVESSERFTYGLEADWLRTPAPDAPIGRRSASLLGTFTAAEGSTSLTSGSRTSTSGSLITATYGVWKSTAHSNESAPGDDKSNTYTEPATSQADFSSGAGSFASVGLGYNIGGTRGASHEVTHTGSSNVHTLGGQEWDGIEVSPTVTVSAASTGSGTAVSDSAGALPAASLLMMVFGYDGSATTYAVNGSVSAQEVDENNDNQTHGVYYNVAQTGSPSIAATLAASRAWGALAVGFTETAGGGTTTPKSPLYFPLYGPLGGRV